MATTAHQSDYPDPTISTATSTRRWRRHWISNPVDHYVDVAIGAAESVLAPLAWEERNIRQQH